jgi:hypothetical protein
MYMYIHIYIYIYIYIYMYVCALLDTTQLFFTVSPCCRIVIPPAAFTRPVTALDTVIPRSKYALGSK